MRYWCYNEPVWDEYGEAVDNVVVTVSDQEIIDTYYPWWYSKMVEKFGKEKVDSTYTKEDCIDDWVIVNWAWESKE